MLYRRARAGDRRDVDACSVLLSPGRDRGSRRIRPDRGRVHRESLDDLSALPTPVTGLWHLISNVLIEVDADTAEVESYHIALVSRHGGRGERSSAVHRRSLPRQVRPPERPLGDHPPRRGVRLEPRRRGDRARTGTSSARRLPAAARGVRRGRPAVQLPRRRARRRERTCMTYRRRLRPGRRGRRNLAGAAGLSTLRRGPRDRHLRPAPRDPLRRARYANPAAGRRGPGHAAGLRVWKRSTFYGADASRSAFTTGRPTTARLGRALPLLPADSGGDAARASTGATRSTCGSASEARSRRSSVRTPYGATRATPVVARCGGTVGPVPVRRRRGLELRPRQQPESVWSTMTSTSPGWSSTSCCDREIGRPDESEMFCDPARPATRSPDPAATTAGSSCCCRARLPRTSSALSRSQALLAPVGRHRRGGDPPSVGLPLPLPWSPSAGATAGVPRRRRRPPDAGVPGSGACATASAMCRT